LELRDKLKNSIFIIPNIIQKNKNLKEKIYILNSSINAGLNFNDEVFSSKINWYGIRKFYLPFNTSYFPDKKKSFLFKKDNIFFVIFESGKILSFDENNFDNNKLFFNNYNSNLEYNFINNERDNSSKILDIKKDRNNLFASLLHRENTNCYKLIIALLDLKNLNILNFEEIFRSRKCLRKNDNFIKNFGKMNIINSKTIVVKFNEKLILIDLDNNQENSIVDLKKNVEIFNNDNFLIKYLNKNNKVYFNILDLKLQKDKIIELINDDVFNHNNDIKNEIYNIFDIKKTNENKFEISYLGKKMKNIFIFELDIEKNYGNLIDQIKIGKISEIISDVIRLDNESFILTFIKEPSIGLLSTKVKE